MTAAGGAPGAGGMAAAGGAPGAGGAVVSACPPGIYCDNFEADTVAMMPAGWTRVGGSNGDWEVAADATSGKAFAQDHAQSSTFRLCYASVANGPPAAPWSGATTLSAQVRILAAGSSGATTALLCVRYPQAGGDAYCLALMANMGAQIQVRNGQTIDGMSTLFPATITTGTAYEVSLSVNAAGALSASLGGNVLGSYTPTITVANGFAAVATQSAEASFDNLVVSQP